jgi:hypothetical protein
MKVKSAVIEGGYMSDMLTIPEIDMDMKEAGSTAKKFENSEHSLTEGVAGRMAIDTTFENITEEHISLVSSDSSDKPAVQDIAKHNYPHRLY